MLFSMRLLMVSWLITSSLACRSYYYDDQEEVQLGCVSGFFLSRPWEPPDINATFRLFDQADIESPRRIFRWNESFKEDEHLFDKTDNLKFIIHGFTESSAGLWLQNLKRLFLLKDSSAKVILVDWSKAAFHGRNRNYINNYFQASNNALLVGRILACFIERIVFTYDIPETSIHVLGHSVGAQIMGRATSWLAERFGIRIGRGTAMDAASPLFSWKGLDPNRKDVRFMLAMHTAVTTAYYKLAFGAVGVYKAFADVNLYPNRGTLYQPACRQNNSFFCSHQRAYIYFTEMVRNCDGNCDFEGHLCESEAKAVRGECSSQAVSVCNHIRKQEIMADKAERSISIVTFETDMDQLNMICDTAENQASIPASVSVPPPTPEERSVSQQPDNERRFSV